MTQEVYMLPEDREWAEKRVRELEAEIQQLGPDFNDAFSQSSETWHDNSPFEAVRDKQSMLAAERHLTWLDAIRSNEPRVAIGPRSALFLPLRHVGAIIIDEAHEPSFKQDQSPRYSALRVASVLASHHQARVIQGSATPLVSEYYLAEQTKKPIIRLTKRARPNTLMPHINIVDMTKKHMFVRHRFFSDTLLDLITTQLESGHQSLIFHNRRGSASTTLCDSCGWAAFCPRCFVPLRDCLCIETVIVLSNAISYRWSIGSV